MKKLVLASAIAALSITAAQAAPTIYGKIVMTTDVIDSDTDDSTRGSLNTAGSRIGVKGAEALTANTDLVYQLEYRIRPDNNDGEALQSRDTYIGLSNKTYGTLLAGRLSALDDMIDYADVSVGGVVGGDDLLVAFNEPRANNAFAYVSPSYNGLKFLGMYSMDELNTTQPDLKNEELGVGPLDVEAYGVGLKYEPENLPVRGGVTYISTANIPALDDKITELRVSGSYDVTPALTVGALYQNTDWTKEDKENGYTLSAKYKTATPWSVYGQLDYVDNFAGVSDREKQRAILGGEYAFNKAATGHVYAGYLKDKAANRDDQNEVGVGAGLEYNF